jgi:phage terminase small subunit
MTAETEKSLLSAPYWLSEAARGYWERWAPEAVTERTLTPATAAGFEELCKRADLVAQLAVKIHEMGMTDSGLPFVKTFDSMQKGMESMLLKFRLTAFGKPMVAAETKPAENPWAKVG